MVSIIDRIKLGLLARSIKKTLGVKNKSVPFISFQYKDRHNNINVDLCMALVGEVRIEESVLGYANGFTNMIMSEYGMRLPEKPRDIQEYCVFSNPDTEKRNIDFECCGYKIYITDLLPAGILAKLSESEKDTMCRQLQAQWELSLKTIMSRED